MSFRSKKAKRQNSEEKLLSAVESYSQCNGISPFCVHLNGIWKTQLLRPMHTSYGAKWGTLPARPSPPSAADLNLALCPLLTAHRVQVKLTQTLPNLTGIWSSLGLGSLRSPINHQSMANFCPKLTQVAVSIQTQHTWHLNQPLPSCRLYLKPGVQSKAGRIWHHRARWSPACLEDLSSLFSHMLTFRVWKIS